MLLSILRQMAWRGDARGYAGQCPERCQLTRRTVVEGDSGADKVVARRAGSKPLLKKHFLQDADFPVRKLWIL